MTTVTDEQKGQLVKWNWFFARTANTPLAPTYHFVILIFLSITLFLCQNSLADTNPAPVFELTHTFGGNPTSVIKIYPDGKVHFHSDEADFGHFSTKAEDRYAQMTPEQLNELVNVFLSLPFESSKKLERAKDSASVPWRVYIAYKDKFISITIQDTIFFEFLINRMRTYANLKPLLCAKTKQDDCGANVFNIPDDYDTPHILDQQLR